MVKLLYEKQEIGMHLILNLFSGTGNTELITEELKKQFLESHENSVEIMTIETILNQ